MNIVFMGTPPAAVPSLAKILKDGHKVVAVWTQPDRPSGRGKKLKASAVKEFALEKGLEVYQPEKIKTRRSIALFKSHAADVAVVVAYGRVLTKSYLNAFPHGCINVHFSLLPKYRGAAPVNWAIVNGESKTGVTTMKMDRGLDTGDILLQSETQISRTENSIELMERLSVEGAELLGKTLASLADIVAVGQEHEKATIAPMMSKEDGLIDWNQSAQEIANRVRGFQPFPRSYTIYRGQKLTVWKAAVIEADEFLKVGSAGEVVRSKGDELIIQCGGGSFINIIELQVEGKRRMTTRDVLNGVDIPVGSSFGG